MSAPLTVLVPRGAEFAAVRRGVPESVPVVPIPAGAGVRAFALEQVRSPRVLLAGLCGSLTPAHCVGDVVLWDSCRQGDRVLSCDPDFTRSLQREGVVIASGLTSDTVVCAARAKQDLHERTGATVVDMEGFWLLDTWQGTPAPPAVAMLRVVSDGCDRDLPDLSRAITPDGRLQAGTVALSFLRQPLASVQFARDAARSLSCLTRAVAALGLG